MKMSQHFLFATVLLGAVISSCLSFVMADGLRDNNVDQVRRIPKLGVEVSDVDRAELEAGLKQLSGLLAKLKNDKKQQAQNLLPDVEIYYRAVKVALEHQEFFKANEVETGKRLLKTGIERANQLLAGNAPWTKKTGLVVRGYRSRIDKTVQPYGLVIPVSYEFTGPIRYRCDLWFHGRGENLSEVNFISQRERSVGAIAPQDTIVLHPYGRYSNAFKFAGEVDVLEALEATKKHYRVDSHRIASRGFSMGGAAAWQFGVHYADQFFAVNPGAGFSETPEFLKFFQKERLNPTSYERKLWHMYDCPDYVVNLLACPTVAYSGEFDIQKQAADIMAEAFLKEGVDMTHIIGPKTKHRIHPESKKIIEQKMELLSRSGRELTPREVRFVTYTLKYNRMHWLTLNGMQEHWEKASVNGKVQATNEIQLTTENVTDLTLSFPAGSYHLKMAKPVKVIVDGQSLTFPGPQSDLSWSARLNLNAGRWVSGQPESSKLSKVHNLQGPIDDAFMDSFVIVKPTNQTPNSQVQTWTESELEHAIVHWRQHFRGDAQVVSDTKLTDEQIANSNLVLFGDPASNSVLKKIVAQLPINWDAQKIVVGSKTYDAKHHAVAMIYPNPLNPKRYVVLNSGFTFREYDYLNNARQVPKLPDWAIIDLNTPVNSRYPGKIVDADFFDESWQLKTAR